MVSLTEPSHWDPGRGEWGHAIHFHGLFEGALSMVFPLPLPDGGEKHPSPVLLTGQNANAQLQSFQQRGGGKSNDFVVLGVLGPQWVLWQRGSPVEYGTSRQVCNFLLGQGIPEKIFELQTLDRWQAL